MNSIGQNLFIFGMFRSGTTFVCRMVNTHPEILSASEPFRPLFKRLRNYIAERKAISISPKDPFHDYFADSRLFPLFREIQELSDLDFPFPEAWKKELLREIPEFHKLTGDPVDEPEIMEMLEAIEGDTFRQVYDNLLSLIPRVYHSPTASVKWTGAKELWITEFLPVLARTYPDARFILCIRDPRAVIASSNKSYPKKPFLFLVRQWRKLTALTWYYSHVSAFKERVLPVKYENLISRPEETARSICRYLEVDLDPRMLNPADFTNSRGEQWRQNSSYDHKSLGFDKNAIFRWKDELDETEIRFIEELCYEEMNLLGYDTVFPESKNISPSTIASPPVVPEEEQPQWVLDYMNQLSPLDQANDISKELARKLLLSPKIDTSELDPQVLEGYFLKPEVYEALYGRQEANVLNQE